MAIPMVKKLEVRRLLGFKKGMLFIGREPGKSHMKEAYAAQVLLKEVEVNVRFHLTDTGVEVHIVKD